MDSVQLQKKVLDLMADKSYMPLRKRGLARELEIDDEAYAEFRNLLEDMTDKGLIAELKRGKYGLPRTTNYSTSIRESVTRNTLAFAPPVGETFGGHREQSSQSRSHEPMKSSLKSRQPEGEIRDEMAWLESQQSLASQAKNTRWELPRQRPADAPDKETPSVAKPLKESPYRDRGDSGYLAEGEKSSPQVKPKKFKDKRDRSEKKIKSDRSERSENPNEKIDTTKSLAPLPKDALLGQIDIKRGGMGFLLSDPPGNDVFIPETNLGGAVSGDKVAVVLERHAFQRTKHGRGSGNSFRRTGRVIRILERAHKTIVGTFYLNYDRGGGELVRGIVGYIQPDTYGIFHQIDVKAEDRNGAKNLDKVSAELIESSAPMRTGLNPNAKIVKVFGPAGEADADILAIIENHRVHTKFPEDVLKAAEEIPEVIPEAELAQRTCYDHPVTFTIDPEDARDHDDAVAIQKEPNGHWTLFVHIADVSYYVPEDGVIDKEARERATSVYLPGQVYPMLPHKLSNNMCSLKEGQRRLTKTVSMSFGPNLTMQQIKIERSYMTSAAFLTYDIVKAALDDNKPELARTPEIYQALLDMREFATKLRQKRLATGSLELELPKPKLLLDEKMEVKGWGLETHHWAHELIEDMMLAANRAVAEYCIEHEIPTLYRIHEDPDQDSLERFREFVNEFGISLRPPVDRLKLKSVLDRVKGKEFAHTIHLALLTSLKQAKYVAECQPHFALNFARYLHFTSPIRRYPDLISHRALDSRFIPGQAALPIHGKKRKGSEGGGDYQARMSFLYPLAAHCSKREREAGAAESDVIKFKQMQFLRRNMKEAHEGIVMRVRDFGLFVELQDCYVEGLVSVRDLHDDYYEYFEEKHLLQGRKTGRSFQLGDKVEVRITHMDLGKKQVTLQIV
jgi:ribonuclease R